ncbi:MAG: DNA primase [Gemmatimonadota bacterium]
MIPQGFIQDLLARVDIVDVVGRYVQLKKAGQNYLGLCPFHGEKTPSFTVSPSKQFYHCFGCGVHGSAVGFLMESRGLGFVEAVHELAQQAGMQVPETSGGREQTSKARGLADALQQAADFYRRKLKDSPAAIDYLKGRGLSGQTAARFVLGFSPEGRQALREAFETYEDARLVEAGLVSVDDGGRRYDRFRGRVMFPIRNRRGAVIGFGARSIDGSEPKYLNSPETPLFHKGQELYGLFEAQDAIRKRGRAIVCEGYMDVIQLSQAGFGESVAALGTAINSTHVANLFRATDHVIFAFDGDAAGRKAARRALEAALTAIGDAKRASFVFLPEGEDPDSLIKAQGASAFEGELARAMPMSAWFMRVVSEGKSLDTAEGRAAMLTEAKSMLAAMPPGALRLQLIGEVAAAGRMAAADVESLFGLARWRRLPAAPVPRTGRPVLEVGDLKARVLQWLILYPELAREFNAEIVRVADATEQPIDRKLREIWRAATQTAAATTGAVIQSLADSEFLAEYEAIASRGLSGDDDPAAARDEVAGAFVRLTQQRLEALRKELLGRYQSDPSEDNLRAYQQVDREYARLRAGGG